MSPKKSALIALFTMIAALLWSGRAPARQARWHRGLASQPTTLPAAEAVRDLVRARAGQLGLDRVSLSPTERVIVWRNQQIVRIQQEFEGLPVFGRGIVARVDSQGRVRTLRDRTARLDVITVPGMSANEAVAEAEAFVGRPLYWPEATLGILDDGRGGRLVWRVEGNPTVKRVRLDVDAVSGDPLRVYSLARHAWAYLWQDNPVSTPDLELLEIAHLNQDATQLNGRWGSCYRYLSGPAGSSADPSQTEFTQTATLDGTMFDYAPTTDASQPDYEEPFSEVSGYYHLDRVDTYFRDTHGYSSSRFKMIVVNYPEDGGGPMDNAFFTPWGYSHDGIFMGQGTDTDFGYDGDVIYHEYGHSVVHDLTNFAETMFGLDEYGMNVLAGGMDEGLSDYFSSTLTGDPELAEYALADYSRNLDNTNTCPAHIIGESHNDGEVVGGATWEIRTEVGAAIADDLFFGSLAMQDEGATFQSFAQGILDLAEAMVTASTLTQVQYDAIETILEDRGMLLCGRSLPMDNGAEYPINAVGFTQIGGFMGGDCNSMRGFGMSMPLAFQFRISVPADARTARFRVQFLPGVGDLSYGVYIRQGELVGFDLVPVPMFPQFEFPEAALFDYARQGNTEADRTFTIDLADSPPLSPGNDYYVAVVHQNCPTTQAVVTAETDTTGPWMDAGVPDAGGGADAGPGDNPNDGCGCAQTGGSSLPLAFLLGLIVLAWTRRRRSR